MGIEKTSLLLYFVVCFTLRQCLSFPKCSVDESLSQNISSRWRYSNNSKSCLWVSQFPANFYDAARICFLEGAHLISSSDNHLVDEVANLYVNDSNSIEIWINTKKFMYIGAWIQSSNFTYLQIKRDSSSLTVHTHATFNLTVKRRYACHRRSYASPIGFEENSVKDNQLFASSSYKPRQSTLGAVIHSPEKARLNAIFHESHYYGSGWCSSINKTGEFLEFQAESPTIFTGIALQSGSIRSCRHWVSRFKISSRKNVFSNWTFTRWNDEDVIYKGIENDIGMDYHFNEFHSVLPSTFIRIYPILSGCSCPGLCNATFCMRLELYGRVEDDKDLVVSKYFI